MIEIENEAQIKKWGYQEHSLWEWLAFTLEELGELSEAISEQHFRDGNVDDIIKEAVQVATLAIKIAVMCKEQKSELNAKPKGEEMYEGLWGMVEETLNKVHCQAEPYTEEDATHLLNNILTEMGFILPQNAYPEERRAKETPEDT
jgi:NTP pyrophosphatase (non-canonical NTP hydrolase)